MIENKKLSETLIFLTKLLLFSIPLYLVIWLGIDLGFLQETVTKTVFSFLNLMGVSVERQGFLLIFENFSVNISKDCTGWKGLLFLSALILSTKASWKKKAAGLAVGLPAFFAFNLLRILFMIWLGMKNPELFDLFHDFLWQFSMIIVVLVLWLMWTRIKIKSFANEYIKHGKK
ncbi:MAG: archaeosortase/exosortase family protein [Candidatus Aenigmarchaeota archaeon]|nr:archaeosortase/exosortase family protein [Candidatus Aenigmarchaeota archaeon]